MLPQNRKSASIEALVARAVVPELVTFHSRDRRPDPECTRVIHFLTREDPAPAWKIVEELCKRSSSIADFSARFLEPAARSLGDLWSHDECSEFELTLALSHLQIALRRASASIPYAKFSEHPGPVKILLAPPPREPHLLGSLIASEVLRHAGWHVIRLMPSTDEDLVQALQDEWFDVLDISSSTVFAREHGLSAIASSVRASRSCSRNPDLIVVIDGRLVYDHPTAIIEVGADAGSRSADHLVGSIAGQIRRRRRKALGR